MGSRSVRDGGAIHIERVTGEARRRGYNPAVLGPNSGSAQAAPRRRPGRWSAAWWLLVVAVLGVIAGIQVLPGLGQLGSRFATNPGDPALLMWQMTLQSHALVHHPAGLLQGNVFWPHDHTLAYSDNLIGFLPVFAPVLAISGDNSILAYNVTAWVAYLLGGLAVYGLAAHLLQHRAAALTAAVLFAAAPYRSAAVGHIQLSGFLFVPLALLLLIRLVESRRRADAVLLGLCAAGAWLTSLYAFEMLLVALLAFAVVWGLLNRRRLDLRLGGLVAAAAGVAALLIAPTLPAYIAVARSGSLSRDLSTLITAHVADLGNLPPSPVYRALGADHQPFQDITGLFPGTVLLGLALAAVLLALAAGPRPALAGGLDPLPPRVRAHALPLLAAAAVGVAVMAGPNHGILVSEPDRLMRRLIPGMVDIRDLTRFWLLPLSLLAVGAAAGLRLLVGRLGPRLGHRGAAALVLAVLAAAGVETLFRPDLSGLDRDGPGAAVNRALAAMPEGPVVELPLPVTSSFGYALVVAPRQLRSDIDGDPRLEGYSGSIPAGSQRAVDWARALPDPGALGVLRHDGLRYIVLHGGAGPCLGHFSAAELAAVVTGLVRSGAVARVVPAGTDTIVELAPDPGAVPGSVGGLPPPAVPDRAAPACDIG